MQSYQEQEVSLHRLLQLNTAVPDYIQVKPKGFKAILQSTVEFLEAYDIQADLLVKLPVGETWHEDIQRYGQGLASPHRVFRFLRPHADRSLPPTSTAEIGVSLYDDSAWRGDYFVVIQSEEFAAMVVAHRLQPLAASLLGDRPKLTPAGQRPPDDDDDDHDANDAVPPP